MKVTLLNPEEVKNIYKEWGIFACECYDTPKNLAEKVGNACNKSGHYSGSRTEYIKFQIEGVDRGVAEQALRHEIGVRQTGDELTYDENPNNIIKNMKSFRYVNMDNFEYTTPNTIEIYKEAQAEYDSLMDTINKSRMKIRDILESKGVDTHTAIEDANYVLPRATNTSFCIAFTLEAFIHYMHKRLCRRAQLYHGILAKLMRIEVLKVLPDLYTELVPHCKYLLWCPEGDKSCGMMPTKEELKICLSVKEKINE